MDKAPDAYRTISEVADELDLPQHVLRFWETRFAQIKPLKRGGGRRYYRPDDIDLLRGIRHLLYGEGYTIRGVQRIIKESGIKAIQALGRGEGSVPRPKPGGPDVIEPDVEDDDAFDLAPDDDGPEPAFPGAPDPVLASAARPAPPSLAPAAEAPHLSRRLEPTMQPAVQPPMAPPPVPPVRPSVFREAPVDLGRVSPEPRALAPSFAAAAAPPDLAYPAMAEAPAPEPIRPVAAPAMPSAAPPQPVRYAEPLPSAAKGSAAALAADHIRRLQAALYELSECRRRLDQAFEAR